MKIFSFVLAIAFMPFLSNGQDTSGTYTPAVLNSISTINVVPGTAHWFRIGDQVYVQGSAFLNGFPVVGKKGFFSVSTPFPVSDFLSAKGMCAVFQSLPPAVVGNVQGEPSVSQIQITWLPTFSGIANMNFNFTYTAAAQ